MDHHGLYQAVGRIEGSLEAFRAESRGQFLAIARQLDEGHRVMHWHDKRLTGHEGRLTDMEQARTAQQAPQAPSRRAVAVEILKAIAPAGGWAPWLLLAFLAVTGIWKPEQVRDFALGLPSAPSSAPAPE